MGIGHLLFAVFVPLAIAAAPSSLRPKNKFPQGSTRRRGGLTVRKRSDVNLAACMAATVLAAILGGAVGFGPGANWHIHTSFAAGEPGHPKKPARVVEITMRARDGEMTFVPAVIEVRKGEQIRFVLKNESEFDHEFVLDSFDRNAKRRIEMEKNPVMEYEHPNAKRIAAKKSAKIHWRFTKAGTFEFADLHPDHYDAGMKGVVVVTNGPSVAGAKQEGNPSAAARF
jgi:uncharacterized cupredoxin-like copper-binding protein